MIAPSEWQSATVASREQAAEDMITIRLIPDEPVAHRAGQHYEVRFPKDDLSRKFSIVSSPASLPVVELGVQVLPTGLVSPRLAQVATGEPLEIRGPLGRAFVWTPSMSRNLLLLGAGAGVTPLLSMWAQFHEADQMGACRFVLSTKTTDRVYRYDRHRDKVELRLTASAPRLTVSDIEKILAGMQRSDLSVRICGPSGFITTMVDALIALGVDEGCIRSEGFA